MEVAPPLVPPHQHLSVADYLALEVQLGTKLEFENGRIYQMAGGSYAHGVIASNMTIEVGAKILSKSCSVFSSDLKISIAETSTFLYPDLGVVCGEPEFFEDRQDMLTNPILVVEVCSPSSMSRDLLHKLDRYLLIPSLREYVVVQQDQPLVDVYRRQPGGMLEFVRYSGLASTLLLQSIDVQVPLAAIYRRVEFPPPPKDPAESVAATDTTPQE